MRRNKCARLLVALSTFCRGFDYLCGGGAPILQHKVSKAQPRVWLLCAAAVFLTSPLPLLLQGGFRKLAEQRGEGEGGKKKNKHCVFAFL